jgi:hypothetical protein
MTPDADAVIVEAMLKYGGSFVQALAHAWQRGDRINRLRLQGAFQDYWAHYADLVQQERDRAQ